MIYLGQCTAHHGDLMFTLLRYMVNIIDTLQWKAILPKNLTSIKHQVTTTSKHQTISVMDYFSNSNRVKPLKEFH